MAASAGPKRTIVSRGQAANRARPLGRASQSDSCGSTTAEPVGSGRPPSHAVSKRLPKTALFDPELVGFILQRAWRLAGKPAEDFQDVALWRRLVVLGVHATTRVRENVIVPMAFSNLSYLKEIQAGIAQFEPHVLPCLVAPSSLQER